MLVRCELTSNAIYAFGWSNVPSISFSKQVIRQDQENEHLLAAKAKLAKNSRPRAALGDLGNKPSALTSKVKASPLLAFLSSVEKANKPFAHWNIDCISSSFRPTLALALNLKELCTEPKVRQARYRSKRKIMTLNNRKRRLTWMPLEKRYNLVS